MRIGKFKLNENFNSNTCFIGRDYIDYIHDLLKADVCTISRQSRNLTMELHR